MNAQRTAPFLWIALQILAGCSTSATTVPAPAGGAGSAGGSGGDPACSEGLACDVEATPYCCSGADVMACVGGAFALKDRCVDGVSACDVGAGACACELGDRRCEEDGERLAICVKGPDGAGQVMPKKCAAQCDPVAQGCAGEVCTSDLCSEGDRLCHPDLGQVLECQRLPPDNCAQFYPVVSCLESGMLCNEPSMEPAGALDYCVNECGGRGVVLAGEVCDPAPDIPCAVLICDGSDGLKPDHVACKGAGAACEIDNECASCQCDGGSCVGGATARCPGAAKVCG